MEENFEAGVSAEERRVASMFVPPVVYMPVAKVSGNRGPEVEFRVLADGSTGLLVYTALDRLARCCGRFQKWILYPLDKVDDLHKQFEFDRILFDVNIPESDRHQVGDFDE